MTLPAISASTIQLLRFHFSLLLMPVYWFALSQVPLTNPSSAVLVFIILHALVYPASNGYNSYMDKDSTSIGGIQQPLQPTRQLFRVTVLMDCCAVLLGFAVSYLFALGVLWYILVSKAYSYRGIRLKKYPVIGYLTVTFFQGAFTFGLVYMGCSAGETVWAPGVAMLAAALLIGGFYPLTQIYQHRADLKDGVKTISFLLGYRGTFIFCALIYGIALGTLGIYFFSTFQQSAFYLFVICMLPAALYFIIWAKKVWRDAAMADYSHAMRMNTIAALCTNIAFILIFILNHFEQNR